jgi:hypothetical protein
LLWSNELITNHLYLCLGHTASKSKVLKGDPSYDLTKTRPLSTTVRELGKSKSNLHKTKQRATVHQPQIFPALILAHNSYLIVLVKLVRYNICFWWKKSTFRFEGMLSKINAIVVKYLNLSNSRLLICKLQLIIIPPSEVGIWVAQSGTWALKVHKCKNRIQNLG